MHVLKRRSHAAINLIVSIIVLIFVTLPSISSITLSVYNCIDIFNDGDSYLAVDMSVKCWEGSHAYYARRFGIPIVVFWVIGLPLIAFVQLFRKRTHLQEDKNLRTYGFLYLGLTNNSFYWEILLHFRKVLMISINVFFATFKPLYRVNYI